MVGISGNNLPWIEHLHFKVLRSRPKIDLSMLIKKKKKKRMRIRMVMRRMELEEGRERKEEGGCG
jgi:hypothetical protein